MTKVEKAWCRLVAKVKGSEYSRRDGPPYRALPAIPEPKVRDKARYTIVVIGESGSSHQVELTRFRLRVIAASIAGLVAVIAVLALGLGSFFSSKEQQVNLKSGGSNKPLNEVGKLNTRESASASRENSVDKVRQSPVPATVTLRNPEPTGSGALESGVTGLQKDSTLAGGRDSGQTLGDATASAASEEEKPEDSVATSTMESGQKRPSSPLEMTKPPGQTQPEAVGVTPRSPVVSFNAQDVTASADVSSSGTLSFRLVKDQPDIKFAGYLFVYVEMEDKSGENKIYVYPKQTRLGEGDLPFDFKDGESIAFKYNSRVELPYGDSRPHAALAGVSILLYGENGKIVFQRSFGRQEVTMVSTKNNKAERARSRAGEKRQAL